MKILEKKINCNLKLEKWQVHKFDVIEIEIQSGKFSNKSNQNICFNCGRKVE